MQHDLETMKSATASFEDEVRNSQFLTYFSSSRLQEEFTR